MNDHELLKFSGFLLERYVLIFRYVCSSYDGEGKDYATCHALSDLAELEGDWNECIDALEEAKRNVGGTHWETFLVVSTAIVRAREAAEVAIKNLISELKKEEK